jgi:3',5'-cyclic AMP phosphodiesterase CpdA
MKRRTFLQTSLLGFTLPWSVNGFRLPADAEPVFRFAVASDGHYGQPDTAYAKDFENLTKWLKAEKRRKRLDLVVINGDLFHDDSVFLPKVKASFDQFPTPYYVTRGNHDRVSESVWKQTWGYSLNHDVAAGEYAFLLCDTSNEKGEYLCADAAWLQQSLQKHADKKWIFVFMHIPPNKKWTDHGADCPAIQELLEKTPNVAGIFHGHDHDNDFRKVSGGKPYFFDGHFGGNWGTAYKGYRIVEIFADGNWQSYQYNPTAAPILNAHRAKAR